MAMAKVVDPDGLDTGGGRVTDISIADGGVSQGTLTSADPPIRGEAADLFATGAVILQDLKERIRDLQVTDGGAVFRRGLPIFSFQFLIDGAANLQKVSFDIRPFEGVDLAFAESAIEGDGEEDEKVPFKETFRLSGFFCSGFEFLPFFGGIEIHLLFFGVCVTEAGQAFHRIGRQVAHQNGILEDGFQRGVDILPHCERQSFFFDARFPLLENLQGDMFEFLISEGRKDMAGNDMLFFGEGGFPNKMLLLSGVLFIELGQGHRPLRHTAVSVFFLKCALQCFCGIQTVGLAGELLALTVEGGIVDADTVALETVFLTFGFIDGHLVPLSLSGCNVASW